MMVRVELPLNNVHCLFYIVSFRLSVLCRRLFLRKICRLFSAGVSLLQQGTIISYGRRSSDFSDSDKLDH